MTGGSQVDRQYILILHSGEVVMDWGDGLFQDLRSGAFIKGTDSLVSHRANDGDLDWIKRTGVIEGYNDTVVFILNLPERPSQTLE